MCWLPGSTNDGLNADHGCVQSYRVLVRTSRVRSGSFSDQTRFSWQLVAVQVTVLPPSNRRWVNNTYQNKLVGFYGPIAPPVWNAPDLRPLHATTPPVQSENHAERCAAAAVPLPESPEGQTSKSVSSVSFVGIESNFFTIDRRHRRKKWWTRILKFEFCGFWEFF